MSKCKHKQTASFCTVKTVFSFLSVYTADTVPGRQGPLPVLPAWIRVRINVSGYDICYEGIGMLELWSREGMRSKERTLSLWAHLSQRLCPWAKLGANTSKARPRSQDRKSTSNLLEWTALYDEPVCSRAPKRCLLVTGMITRTWKTCKHHTHELLFKESNTEEWFFFICRLQTVLLPGLAPKSNTEQPSAECC